MDSQRYRWAPNAITAARVASVPVLAWMASRQMGGPFIALLTAALLSDVLDGWIARKLNAVSALGATLDSLADILLVLVVVYAIWPLHPQVYTAHGWVIFAVVILWAVAHAASFLRYGRLASFHTRLIRAGIFAFSLFALVLFAFGFVPWLLYSAALICALGAVEHFIMLYLLPEWTPNLHGGIAEALARRRDATKSADRGAAGDPPTPVG